MTNFTDEENLLLAKSYKKISEDPVIGCDQSGKTLWFRIGVDFRERCIQYFKDAALAKAAMEWADESL